MLISSAVSVLAGLSPVQACALFVSLYILPNPTKPSATVTPSARVQPLAYV